METLGIFNHIIVLMHGDYSLAMDIYLASIRETKAITEGCVSNSAVNEYNSDYSILKNSKLISFIPAERKRKNLASMFEDFRPVNTSINSFISIGSKASFQEQLSFENQAKFDAIFNSDSLNYFCR